MWLQARMFLLVAVLFGILDQGSVQPGNKPHQLATALCKLVYGNARMKNSPDMKRVEGFLPQ